MKKNLKIIISLLAVGIVFSCNRKKIDEPTPDDTNNGNNSKETVVLEGDISSNRVLDANKYYLIRGNVFVTSSAELTIPAGTVLFGENETKGSLIIERGSKIHAIGTESKPIVFTSNKKVGERNIGDWGGLVILGKANNNQSVDQNIEGISSPSDSKGKYGGTNDTDNSGELQYVRIEFAGIALSPNNEINSLTMGSVGSATKIDHIQVSFGGDDSFEWFGGSVNVSHIISYRGVDDDFDTDFGYSGNVQFGIAIRDPKVSDVSASNFFESDNDANGNDTPIFTSPVFSNITCIGPKVFDAATNMTNFKQGVHMRRKSKIQIYNSIISGVAIGVRNSDSKGTAHPDARFEKNLIYADKELNSTDQYPNSTTSNTYSATMPSSLFLNIGTVDAPNPLLGASSPALSGAEDLSSKNAFFKTTSYIGAFGTSADASWNWSSGWVNFDPKNTNY